MAEFDGAAYQARVDALAASGVSMHGEADLVESFAPGSVLDAGCGTGRVAIELARRGIEVVGVDVSASMLSEARRLAPALTWVEADLSRLDLGRDFDVVMLAGNVPNFCPPGARADMIGRCAAHVAPSGALVAGFQLERGLAIDERFALDDWDRALEDAGLGLAARWSTWQRDPFAAGSAYAVSVHRPCSA